MAIRLSTTCINCTAMTQESMCKVHEVKISANYTCDSFDLRPELSGQKDCTVCTRFQKESCTHPAKAAEGMFCLSWAPIA